MIEEKIPKVFISYSWSSTDFVITLAERLMSHGVDVVLDKWDLKEGQDKYVFMEQCVNNPEIDKVLIISDKQYKEKADNRKGGVGNETVIISQEVYSNNNQEKFIPIIVERDEKGEECLPAYINSRIYIDFSDEDHFEDAYETLLRNIYQKPLYVKPQIGNRPEWLDKGRERTLPMRDIIRQIKGATNLKKQEALIRRFQDAHIEVLKPYYNASVGDGKTIFDLWIDTKDIRDCYLDCLEVLVGVDCNLGYILHDQFESMYNTLICVHTFEKQAHSCNEWSFEIFKIYIWELFVCTVTCLRHYEKYDTLRDILDCTYFLNSSPFSSDCRPLYYSIFRHWSRPVEVQYKPQTKMKDHFTLIGETLCNNREKRPIYTKVALAEADLFLYQVYNAYEFTYDDAYYYTKYWFPTCYVYTGAGVSEWTKLKSLRYCQKIEVLFGVSSIKELKQKLSKCTFERSIIYSGAFESAPAILSCIKLDDVGILK